MIILFFGVRSCDVYEFCSTKIERNQLFQYDNTKKEKKKMLIIILVRKGLGKVYILYCIV